MVFYVHITLKQHKNTLY